MEQYKISRRKFIGGLATLAAGVMIVPRHVLGGPGFRAPSDTLNIAGIGIGGKGEVDLLGVASENVVALCDVDWARGADSFARFPKAARYKDFRVLLEQEKGIDAVTISTADHTHAVIAMAAMQLGKHVYCQKPLTHNIYEARRLAEAARRYGVATQMGIQGNANDGRRRVREWIEAGLIGTPRKVIYWTDRPIWPQGIERPSELHAVPPQLDWELWLGPAPERPYHPAYHPFNWRGWWDFGTGALGDIGCHAMDAAFWALDLRNPARVEAETMPFNEETAPKASRITYRFPARGSRPEIEVVWLDGTLMPPRPEELEDGEALPAGIGGQLIVGDEAKILADTLCENPRLLPTSLHEQVMADPPAARYPRSPGHYQEWILAGKGGAPAGANIPDYAAALTEVVLLGNLAVRTREAIEWDAEAMRVTNVPAANQYLRRDYRAGWSL